MKTKFQKKSARDLEKMRFRELMNSPDIENRLRCNSQIKGYAPFNGPYIIIDGHNPYCELFTNMYSSY